MSQKLNFLCLHDKLLMLLFLNVFCPRQEVSTNLKDKCRMKAKVVAASWGTELVQFLAALSILHQVVMKKRINRIMATWRNGCFEKMDNHPIHTTENPHPTKMDVLPKTFLQIILSAKWLVRHFKYNPKPAATTFAFFFL